MTQQNLYSLLGISETASPADVKRAYRRRANKSHPDKGGSAEEFHALKFAYDVLSDPARRARYDRTGEAEPIGADNALSELIGTLSGLLSETAQATVKGGSDVATVDLVAYMIRTAKDRLASLDKTLANAESWITKFSDIRSRFSVEEGKPNHMDGVIAGQLAQLEQQKKAMLGSKRSLAEAKLYLEGVKFAKKEDMFLSNINIFFTVTTE